MMQQKLSDTTALLTRFPAALDMLLRGLPETWTHRNEGGDTWTAFDIVAHLVHAERTDWIPRVRMILEAGEEQTFATFNRKAHFEESRGKELGELLDEFARLRTENLAALDRLKLEREDLARRGRHPAFGVVTLSQLLATWATHDMTHLHQLSRVLAYQYRETVGPWSAYLGVLRCEGHSSQA